MFFSDELLGTSRRWSIGVGGVTCVSGGSSEALVGVLGVVTIVGISRTLAEGLCKLEATDSLLSEALEDLPKLMLFLLSLLNKAWRAFPLPEDISDGRSGLFGGLESFFLDPTVNTSFILVPGETPRVLLPSLVLRVLPPSLESIVAAWFGARFVVEDVVLPVTGSVADF